MKGLFIVNESTQVSVAPSAGAAVISTPTSTSQGTMYTTLPLFNAAEVDTWLGMPGTSHFRLVSDEGAANAAPCGLALLSAGITFC